MAAARAADAEIGNAALRLTFRDEADGAIGGNDREHRARFQQGSGDNRKRSGGEKQRDRKTFELGGEDVEIRTLLRLRDNIAAVFLNALLNHRRRQAAWERTPQARSYLRARERMPLDLGVP